MLVEHGNPLLSHGGPWTEAHYLVLPEQEPQRVELIDGELVLAPHGDARHQNLRSRLCRELERQLPDDIVAVPGAVVRLRAGRLLIPDVVVTTDQSEPLIFPAAGTMLVGEIVSAWGQTRDRVFKPAMYAASGIPWYLLVEREPELELVLHRLHGETYERHAKAARGESLPIEGLSVSIEVDALLRRR